jgi:hypothetical protein
VLQKDVIYVNEIRLKYCLVCFCLPCTVRVSSCQPNSPVHGKKTFECFSSNCSVIPPTAVCYYTVWLDKNIHKNVCIFMELSTNAFSKPGLLCDKLALELIISYVEKQSGSVFSSTAAPAHFSVPTVCNYD